MSEPTNDSSSENRPEELDIKAILAKARQEFTAADLQRYTEEDEGVPLIEVIEEMERIHHERKRTKGKE